MADMPRRPIEKVRRTMTFLRRLLLWLIPDARLPDRCGNWGCEHELKNGRCPVCEGDYDGSEGGVGEGAMQSLSRHFSWRETFKFTMICVEENGSALCIMTPRKGLYADFPYSQDCPIFCLRLGVETIGM